MVFTLITLALVALVVDAAPAGPITITYNGICVTGQCGGDGFPTPTVSAVVSIPAGSLPYIGAAFNDTNLCYYVSDPATAISVSFTDFAFKYVSPMNLQPNCGTYTVAGPDADVCYAANGGDSGGIGQTLNAFLNVVCLSDVQNPLPIDPSLGMYFSQDPFHTVEGPFNWNTIAYRFYSSGSDNIYNLDVMDGNIGSSCPYLFVSSAAKKRAVTMLLEADLQGAGKLVTRSGFRRPARDDVYVLQNVPSVDGGVIDLRFVEEREEVHYFDQATLGYVDVPIDASVMYRQEASTSTLVSVSTTLQAVTVLMNGTDYSWRTSSIDSTYLPVAGPRNAPIKTYVTFQFSAVTTSDATLIMRGFTPFETIPNSIVSPAEAIYYQNTQGDWISTGILFRTLGAEVERTIALAVPAGAVAIRIGFVRMTYIEYVALDPNSPVPLDLPTQLGLQSANLRFHGIDTVTGGNTDRPQWTYTGSGDAALFPGTYTRYGDVTSLLTASDDKMVVYGGGDEVAMKFSAPASQVANGFARFYVFKTSGYYKGITSFQIPTVEPLPFAAMTTYPYTAPETFPSDQDHLDYLANYQTRRQLKRAAGHTKRNLVATFQGPASGPLVLTE